jgi:hypothetical protein
MATCLPISAHLGDRPERTKYAPINTEAIAPNTTLVNDRGHRETAFECRETALA